MPLLPTPLSVVDAAMVTLAFWAVVYSVSHLVARNKKTKARHGITIPPVDDPRPRHVRVRLEHYCAPCDHLVLDPEQEFLLRCTVCGKRWTRSSPVADSVPTPEDTPTLPEAS